MRKKIIMLSAGLMGVLLLSGCGNNKISNQQDQPKNNSQIETPKEITKEEGLKNTSSENSFTGSMKELLGKKLAMECTWNDSLESGDMQGKIYTDGTKFRNDANIEMSGKKMETHALSDGDWLYMWSSAMPKQGMKMKLSEFENQEPPMGNKDSAQASLDMQKKLNFSCKPWVVSASLLETPSDVTFKDATQMMKGFQKMQPPVAAPSAPADGKPSCAMCDMIPDATAKSQCQKNAGCN